MDTPDPRPDHRIVDIALDEATIARWNADIEHERRVAIFDLLESNLFEPVEPLPNGYQGPYAVTLRTEDGRLVFDIAEADGQALTSFRLPLTPFRRIIREYFAVCESYFEAIKHASPSQIEAIDMGRRGLHNDGSELLKERMEEKARIDFDTARRLFTLICVLHLRV